MCIIVYKPKHQNLPSKNILQNCFDRNGDGIGYTFTLNDKVVIKKGYFDFNKFYEDIEKDFKRFKLFDKNLIVHFRISTSVAVNEFKTHPFVLTSKKENIEHTNVFCGYSVVHNGVLWDYEKKNGYTDTQNFVLDFLSPLLQRFKYDFGDGLLTHIIKNELKTSKICVLSYKDEVLKVGDCIKDNGIYYSNASYKPYIYKPIEKPIQTSIFNYNYNNGLRWYD